MTDISDPALSKAINKAKEMAPNRTGNVETMKCDVSKESDVQAVVEHLDSWGGVDVMFNNAGIMHGDDDGMPLIYKPYINISKLTLFKTPSRLPRRYGTSPITSTSKASGSVASTPSCLSANTTRLAVVSLTRHLLWHLLAQLRLN